MSTLSANLTLEGLLLNLAFFAADSNADFRVEDWKKNSEVSVTQFFVAELRLGKREKGHGTSSLM